MDLSYVEVTIPEGMLDYMQKIRHEVNNYLLSTPQREYVYYRSWWTLKLIEHKTCVGVHVPDELAEWIREIFYDKDHNCLDGTPLYNSLRNLIWLSQVGDKVLLNQIDAVHYSYILNKFKGE